MCVNAPADLWETEGRENADPCLSHQEPLIRRHFHSDRLMEDRQTGPDSAVYIRIYV